MDDSGADNKWVSTVLKEIVLFLELKGENPFKVRAYSNAARSIEILEEDLGKVVQEGRLDEIRGIGKTLDHQITELLRTGKLLFYDELKSSVPPGQLEMLKIPGLGPKKIKALYDALDIKTVGELEYACLESRLIELEGFGPKTQEKILRGIQQIKKYQGRYLYGEVIKGAEGILASLRSHPHVIRADLVGSLRRKMEVVRNINLIASSQQSEEVLNFMSKLPQVEGFQFRDDTHRRLFLFSGVEVDLRVTQDRTFPYRLYHLTGTLDHWNFMGRRAQAMGLKLSEEGLYRENKLLPCNGEEEIFRLLDLDFIPPELRENRGEIEAAEARRLPRLIEDQDMEGIFHIHSLHSDGKDSIKTMAETAKEMGFSYIGLSDHSQSARYAGGLNLQKLKRQWEEVNGLNREMEGFHIFKGTESDILSDGSLDYDEDILREFDFVIASVHSHFNMPMEEMTQRVIKALRNPYTTILGHPTGRLLLAREPYSIDMIRIIDEAAQQGVAIELNAHPYRLDIDWRLCRYAKEKGVKIAVNPDAHDEEGLRDTTFGVGIGRKGWLEPQDLLNTNDLAKMKDFLKRRKPS